MAHRRGEGGSSPVEAAVTQFLRHLGAQRDLQGHHSGTADLPGLVRTGEQGIAGQQLDGAGTVHLAELLLGHGDSQRDLVLVVPATASGAFGVEEHLRDDSQFPFVASGEVGVLHPLRCVAGPRGVVGGRYRFGVGRHRGRFLRLGSAGRRDGQAGCHGGEHGDCADHCPSRFPEWTQTTGRRARGRLCGVDHSDARVSVAVPTSHGRCLFRARRARAIDFHFWRSARAAAGSTRRARYVSSR